MRTGSPGDPQDFYHGLLELEPVAPVDHFALRPRVPRNLSRITPDMSSLSGEASPFSATWRESEGFPSEEVFGPSPEKDETPLGGVGPVADEANREIAE